jgi:hypothetical protein
MRVIEFCQEQNITYLEPTGKNDQSYEEINKNRSIEITIRLECGHIKIVKVSSLACKKYRENFGCLDCRRKENNPGYDPETNCITCQGCKTLFRLPEQNINHLLRTIKNNCFYCKEPNKYEHKFYKSLTNKLEIYKNYKFDGYRLVEDFYIKHKKDDIDYTVIIALDEAGHIYQKKTNIGHIMKDNLISEMTNNTIMIRLHSEIMFSFINDYETIINEAIDNHSDNLFYYHGCNKSEINMSKTFYDKVRQFHTRYTEEVS